MKTKQLIKEWRFWSEITHQSHLHATEDVQEAKKIKQALEVILTAYLTESERKQAGLPF